MPAASVGRFLERGQLFIRHAEFAVRRFVVNQPANGCASPGPRGPLPPSGPPRLRTAHTSPAPPASPPQRSTIHTSSSASPSFDRSHDRSARITGSTAGLLCGEPHQMGVRTPGSNSPRWRASTPGSWTSPPRCGRRPVRRTPSARPPLRRVAALIVRHHVVHAAVREELRHGQPAHLGDRIERWRMKRFTGSHG